MIINHLKNETLKTILHYMCRFIDVDPLSVNIKKENWYWDHTWTDAQQTEFKEWLINYFLENPKDLEEISKFPNLLKGNKKRITKLANKFIGQYGWKVK